MSEYTGIDLPKDAFSQFLGRTTVGGITGGVTSEMNGGSFSDGFLSGAQTAGFGYLFNHMTHYGYKVWKQYYYGVEHPVPINPFTFEGFLSTFAVGFGNQVAACQWETGGQGIPAGSLFDFPAAIISGALTVHDARNGKQVYGVPKIFFDPDAPKMEKIIGIYTQKWDEAERK